jgi:hypothetical protein
MRRQVKCRLIGGPKGEETLTISVIACRDTLRVMRTWIAQGQDGVIRIMRGRPMPPRAPWIAYTEEIYERVKPVMPGQVTYRFARVHDVVRCEKVLNEKGRRCGNKAESGTKLCRMHQRG